MLLGSFFQALIWFLQPCEAQEYRVGAGDTIGVQVFGEPQLSRDIFVPTGCHVDVELIGSIPACGRTPREIAEDIRVRYSDGFLVQPRVIVDVKTFGSQRIEVRGAVKEPGIQVLMGPTTVSQAITAAGGPNGANVVDVDLVKRDGTVTSFQISQLDSAEELTFLEAGDTVILRPGRLVYVEGEVKTVGPVPYCDGLTVSQALNLAGGPGPYASLRRVNVLTAKGVRIRVNLQKVREGRASDLVLGPGDRVIVKRSFL